MLDRLANVWGVLLGVLGLAILGALIVIGLDLRRARRHGPRWRRRIAAAAVALLSAAGAYLAARNLPPEPKPDIMCYYYMRLPQPGPEGESDAAGRRVRRRLELLASGRVSTRLCARVLQRVREQGEADRAVLGDAGDRAAS